MKRFDFGGGILLGYEFNNRLQILATYKMGFLNLINEPENDISMRHQRITQTSRKMVTTL